MTLYHFEHLKISSMFIGVCDEMRLLYKYYFGSGTLVDVAHIHSYLWIKKSTKQALFTLSVSVTHIPLLCLCSQDVQCELDMNLLCWGSGELGQTGHGRPGDIGPEEAHLTEFTRVQLGRVKLLACGSSHSIVITGTGLSSLVYCTLLSFIVHSLVLYESIN